LYQDKLRADISQVDFAKTLILLQTIKGVTATIRDASGEFVEVGVPQHNKV
jgi:hypothetical protein